MYIVFFTFIYFFNYAHKQCNQLKSTHVHSSISLFQLFLANQGLVMDHAFLRLAAMSPHSMTRRLVCSVSGQWHTGQKLHLDMQDKQLCKNISLNMWHQTIQNQQFQLFDGIKQSSTNNFNYLNYLNHRLKSKCTFSSGNIPKFKWFVSLGLPFLTCLN